MRELLTLLFFTICLTTTSQENTIVGTWSITNVELDNYHIHDTVTFKSNGEFLTTTVKQTTNEGRWSYRLLKSNELKLRACLHSADNPYKCRDFKWNWVIEKINDTELVIVQNSNWGEKKLIYRKIITHHNKD